MVMNELLQEVTDGPVCFSATPLWVELELGSTQLGLWVWSHTEGEGPEGRSVGAHLPTHPVGSLSASVTCLSLSPPEIWLHPRPPAIIASAGPWPSSRHSLSVSRAPGSTCSQMPMCPCAPGHMHT